jgi:spoIIIJ-associated protein
VEGFVRGLVDAFGATATIEVVEIDDETREVRVSGDDLGLLIGPRGLTLQAVHELARTVVYRAAPDGQEGRVRIDIGGYRERRRQALEAFATKIAQEVAESGAAKALEPMSPPDRKVVHDTINGVEGVRTTSEGEEPRRRVVVLPDA